MGDWRRLIRHVLASAAGKPKIGYPVSKAITDEVLRSRRVDAVEALLLKRRDTLLALQRPYPLKDDDARRLIALIAVEAIETISV